MDFSKPNERLKEKIKNSEHEEVFTYYDEKTGLKTIIAIHNSTFGPALGGVRMVPYKSEEDALEDVLRLSQGMTYKAAFLGLNYGGGKAVIIGDPKKNKSEKLLRAFGQFVHSLKGRYITAKDSGIDIKDISNIAQETSYIAGRPKALGGPGDPSLYTAYGLFKGLISAIKYKLKKNSLDSISVAIQGIGSVGKKLVEYLFQGKASLTISDLSQKKVEDIKKSFPSIHSVSPQDILQSPCDVLSPCALGGIIHSGIIQKLKCKIIAGAANNQLLKSQVDDELEKKNILYVPDFVINSGGLTCVALDYSNRFVSEKDTLKEISKIEQKLIHLFNESKKANVTPLKLAHQWVKKKLKLLV